MKSKKKVTDSDKNHAEQDTDLSQPSMSTASEMDSSFDDHLDWLIDQALIESFPASDPPCWTLGRGQSARGDSLEQIKKDDEDSTETDSGK